MMTTFAVNYVGRPFNQPIHNNRPLFFTLATAFGLLALILTANGEPFEDMLDLVPVPEVSCSARHGHCGSDHQPKRP